MELSQEMIVDIALNVVGYLAAAGLMAIVFSFRKGHRPEVGVAVAKKNSGAGSSISEFPEPFQSSEAPTFVRFGQSSHTSPGRVDLAVDNNRTDNSRRDRMSIVRTARMMLKAGASWQKIKRVLPISEAELALLSAGQNE